MQTCADRDVQGPIYSNSENTYTYNSYTHTRIHTRTHTHAHHSATGKENGFHAVARTHTPAHTTHTNVHTDTNTRTHIHTHMHTHTAHAMTDKASGLHAVAITHKNTHINIHTHTHTHTHTKNRYTQDIYIYVSIMNILMHVSVTQTDAERDIQGLIHGKSASAGADAQGRKTATTKSNMKQSEPTTAGRHALKAQATGKKESPVAMHWVHATVVKKAKTAQEQLRALGGPEIVYQVCIRVCGYVSVGMYVYVRVVCVCVCV